MVLLMPSAFAFAQSGGTFDLSWNTIDGGGGTSTGGTFTLNGTAGQSDAGTLGGGTFILRGGYWVTGPSASNTCATAADCADLDGGGATDDVCTWWECVDSTCVSVAKAHPSDMGGALGDCALDTFCNLADALHALTCFAGNNSCDTINIDAGGALGACAPDGFCNLADALHALTCFAGNNTCACGPSPGIAPEPNVVGAVSLTAVADRSDVRPGEELTVRIYADVQSPERKRWVNVRAYQLNVGISGGRGGSLELVNIEIEERKDFVFGGAADAFNAFNVETGQMLSGLYDGHVEATGRVYLATFTYRVSNDARGTFVIDVIHDATPQSQTFLVGPSQTDEIEVEQTTPAVVRIASRPK